MKCYSVPVCTQSSASNFYSRKACSISRAARRKPSYCPPSVTQEARRILKSLWNASQIEGPSQRKYWGGLANFSDTSPQPFWLRSTDDHPFVGAGGFCNLSIFHDLPSNSSTVDAIVPGEG